MLPEKNPRDFLTAIDILFWLIKDNKVLAIPIPAINIALIDTSDKNWEKLFITLFNPLAAFSGYLSFTFWSFSKIFSIFLTNISESSLLLNFTLYS